jgi:hypothetical protein
VINVPWPKGKPRSQESRDKIKASVTPELRAKIAASNKRRIWTEEMRVKQSQTSSDRLQGHSVSAQTREKLARFHTGLKASVQTRARMSAKKQKENNANWRGGIADPNRLLRNSLLGKLWIRAVFVRDNFACQECGQRGGALEAHHIQPFSYYEEARFDVDNGKTLCVKCHDEFDKFNCDVAKMIKFIKGGARG